MLNSRNWVINWCASNIPENTRFVYHTARDIFKAAIKNSASRIHLYDHVINETLMASGGAGGNRDDNCRMTRMSSNYLVNFVPEFSNNAITSLFLFFGI